MHGERQFLIVTFVSHSREKKEHRETQLVASLIFQGGRAFSFFSIMGDLREEIIHE